MSEFKAKDIVVMNVPKGSFYDYNGLMEVSIAIDGEPRVFIGWHPIFKYGSVDKSVIRHATPEEIAAGHRIDKPSNSRELEILDKPENHISPNCKVTEAHINEADKLNRLG
ncbi:hypothetical protein OHW27_12045 [Acinetobacter baumannii]|nr:hypothetical protein [Acinetobacter baumannii]MDC5382142.1 hypothetical protein [Acinetobacter baumannii]